LGRELGFAFVVRPGPVIRNEWRNGGYPAWLLTRPEYGMPLHDVLEGRYPATATLQNAHSDDAAAQWMRNATHMRYTRRWLHRALDEFRPVADRVLAVQLDDDQGAYIDNQTYPAPHLERYLRWLDAQVRDVVGSRTPTFINTYAMRVPASSPVWTMGNWYQSDAYAIGDHDRVALDVATSMLRTNRRGPLAASEFQAGWLAQPEDPQPRPADPSNTILALYELLGWGAHGVIDFPMQDTLAPFGWEAPFSNALYAWDAALRYPWHPAWSVPDPPPDGPLFAWAGDRYGATAEFGRIVRVFGPLLAEAHRLADVAVVYPASTYPGTNEAMGPALTRFREHVRECAARGTPCEVVDLASTGEQRLRTFRTLVIVDDATRRRHAALLQRFERAGGRLATTVPVGNIPGIVLRGADATFLVSVNWSNGLLHVRARDISLRGSRLHVPAFDVPPRSGQVVVLDLRLHRVDARYAPDAHIATTCDLETDSRGVWLRGSATACEFAGYTSHRSLAGAVQSRTRIGTDLSLVAAEPYEPSLTGDVISYGGGRDNVRLSRTSWATLQGMHPPGPGAETYRADAFGDGASDVVIQNAQARLVVVPDGGARVPVFALFPPAGSESFGGDAADNAFDATGALRDDVLVQPPPSPTDRIAKYTHSYPAGTFNRRYAVSGAAAGTVRLTADVPDVFPNGARFERVLSLPPDAARLIVDERVTFNAGDGADRQRGVVLSTLSTDAGPSDKPSRRLYVGSTQIDAAGDLPAPQGVALIDCELQGCFVLAISWRPGDVESASWEPHRSNGTLRMVLALGWRRVTYALARVRNRTAAQTFVEAERAWVAANPPSKDGEVAKRYTQSPQKRPSESSCGFESHLPQ
jgi:hypothetical protein